MGDKASRRELRKFGLFVGGVFGLIGLWPAVGHGQPMRLWALALSCLLMIPGILFPMTLVSAHKGWMRIGHLLGWVNTRIIMAIIFFLVVTPMAWIMRWLAKDPMLRRFEPDAETYRVQKGSRPAAHMTKQY